jgi:hypothetical protein
MNPVVYISNYNGRLGNHMFQFAWAKALSLELNYDLSVPGIACDPEGDTGSLFSKTHGLKKITHKEFENNKDSFIELNDNYAVTDFQGKNIRGNGYFQNYHTFKKYKNEIKEYFTLDHDRKGKDTLGVHIRLDDFPQQYRCTPEFYFNSIEQSNCKNIFVFTDEPSHPFIRYLEQRYSNLTVDNSYDCSGKNNKQVLSYMTSCDELVISRSTYSWWAAFLSNARKVYFPDASQYNNSIFPIEKLLVDDEVRYVKIECKA